MYVPFWNLYSEINNYRNINQKYNISNSYRYILKCSDASYYVGSTKDVGLRFWQHFTGKGAIYTSKRLPVQLIYVEIFTRIDHAFEREHQLKK